MEVQSTIMDTKPFDWVAHVGPEWAEWYAMTPQERLEASSKLWQTYLELGGSLDPEPDSQSPFYSDDERRAFAAHGRPGLRVVRRGGV